MNSIEPGPGRVHVRIEGDTLVERTSDDYGGGASLATNLEEWSNSVKEVGVLMSVDGIISGNVRERKHYNFFSNMEDASHKEWIDRSKEGSSVRREDLLPLIGRRVLFTFKSYFDLWEIMGMETDVSIAVGDCTDICPLVEELVAYEDDDGNWQPITGSGNVFVSLVDDQQGLSLNRKKEVYLLYRSLGIPLMDRKQATGDLLRDNIVRVNEKQIVATVRK